MTYSLQMVHTNCEKPKWLAEKTRLELTGVSTGQKEGLSSECTAIKGEA